MKLSVTLNGKKQQLEAEPQTPLSQVLRTLGLFSIKKTGQNGTGCSCTILLNGKPVPSDIIPFAIVKNSKIMTLEYFEQTENFQYISKGFEQAGVKLCGYCNSGMIFMAHDIMTSFSRPTVEEIEEAAQGISYCCTSKKLYIAGIRCAISYKLKKAGINKNGRK